MGYSLLTNKYGLGMDNVVEFQVLLPGAKTVCEENTDPTVVVCHSIFSIDLELSLHQ